VADTPPTPKPEDSGDAALEPKPADAAPTDAAPADAAPTDPSAPVEPTPTAATRRASAQQRFGTGRFDTQKLTLNSALRTPFLKNLLRLPLKKIAIWGSFAGVLFALRDFFGLIFLTFVLSYITGSIVDRVSTHFSSRRIPILLVFAGFLGILVGLGFATVPRAVRAGEQQLRQMRSIEDPGRHFEVRLGRMLGRRPELEVFAGHQGGSLGAVFGSPDRRAEDPGLLASLTPYLSESSGSELLRENLGSVGKTLRDYLAVVLKAVWTSVFYLFLALIFSFMIVWDRERLSAGFESMEESRLGDVWIEVAPSIATFGRLLGKAFEAQTLIAIVNTALTAVGMAIMGIPGLPALSLVVFVCSFVPIAGVYASTLPIFLVAIQTSGMLLGVGVIVMVSGVHVIEAYVLNPRIYGHHMKLHPLVVLIVLTLGGHLIGVWGLILGVPLATYVWRHLVLGEAEHLYAPATQPPGPPAVHPPGPPSPAIPSAG
jgi:predicted PurR-regulated permease PerM